MSAVAPSPLRRGDLVLRNLGLPGRGPSDVVVVDGRIGAISASADAAGSAPGPPATGELDLDGYIALPRLVEPHLHLDKVFTAERIPDRSWTLNEAIDAWIASCGSLRTSDLVARGTEAIRRYIARGVTAVRVHVDTVPALGLRGVEAAVRVRERFRDVVDVQVVAGCFIPAAGLAGAGNLARLRDAVAAGADCVGGFPSLEDEPARGVEALSEVAASCGVGLDLHIDETIDPAVFALQRLIDVAAAGFPGAVNASHAVSLGRQPPERQRAVADAMARAGVTVVTLPQTNLLLQGRGAGSLAPRGLTALEALLDAGVTVGAGADNIQDGFNPLGRVDPFETAALLVAAGHLDIPAALRAVSAGASAVLGLPESALRVGDRADFVAVRAASPAEAVASAPLERVTVRNGRVLARTTTITELDLPAPALASGSVMPSS
jgi:cytosine deaminase